jgi:ATP-dependent RNA helicase DDX5/DBP2
MKLITHAWMRLRPAIQSNFDVDDIKFVINYDYPNSGEDYVHRIGRTGRRDRKGTAFTFFTSANGKQANELIEVLKEANQTIEPKLYDLAQQSRYMSGNKRRRYGTAGGGGGHWKNNSNGYSNGSAGGFKRKFEGSSGAPPAKRREYDSTKSRFGSQNTYNSSNGFKSTSNSYPTNGAVSQTRYTSWD